MHRLLIAVALALLAPAAAASAKTAEFFGTDDVLRWMNTYRTKPEPSRLPAAVRALSSAGSLRDPESAGASVGFVAGIIAQEGPRAARLIERLLPLPAQDQWMLVRAIAYSGHPQWEGLLQRFAPRLSARQAMLDGYLAGRLPRLAHLKVERSPTLMQRARSYLTLRKPAKTLTLVPSGEVLDTLWGYYFATGADQPLQQIISLLPLATDRDDIEKLTLGNMAKYTLATNAARDPVLLAAVKRASQRQPPQTLTVLNQVIESAERVELGQLRKEALGSMEELKTKGPAYRRQVNTWGQVGQGAVSLGCVAAAAVGQVALGLPCVVGGALSSAVLHYWNQP